MQKLKFGRPWLVCALVGMSAACRVQVTDGSGEGGSANAAGGETNASGGAALGGSGSGGAASGGASAAGGAMATGGASGIGANVEDCGHPDAIPNDDREHAVSFGSGATICVTDSSDSDWFYVDTPDDHRAHVIQLDLSEGAGSWVDLEVVAGSDGSNLGRVHPSQRGLKLSAFVTVGPGTRTLFDIHGFVANTDTTTIAVSLTTEMDEHEPNNDRGASTPIAPGTEVVAQLINPYVSQTDQQIADYYKVDVSAGQHTVKVTAVPSDLFPTFQVSDSTGAVLASNSHGPNRGATFSFTFTAGAAGTHYLRVENFTDLPVLYSGVKAASYTEPYKFQVD